MSRKHYSKGLFEKGNETILADEVQVGMIIALSDNKYFYVDDIDKEFINDDIAKSYKDDETVSPEHTNITFYDENDNSIIKVPGTESCICFQRINGTHSSITEEDTKRKEESVNALLRAFKKHPLPFGNKP